MKSLHGLLLSSLSIVLLLSSCDPDPATQPPTITQTIDTVGTRIQHKTVSEHLTKGVTIIDSTYDQAAGGTVKYQHHYTLANEEELTSKIDGWDWRLDSIETDSATIYQQKIHWTSEHVNTPKQGADLSRKENLITYVVSLYSLQPLPFQQTAPIFQGIFEQLNERIPFPADRVAPVTEQHYADLGLNLNLPLAPGPHSDYDKVFDNPRLFGGDAVWVPSQNILLPIDVVVYTKTTTDVPNELVIATPLPDSNTVLYMHRLMVSQ